MKLSSLFTDGAVLQRERPLYIFGTGTGDWRLTFDGETREGRADGRFEARFSPRRAGGPYELTAELDGETVVVRNVMVGDVYIVAGQSNAELPLRETSDAGCVAEGYADIRFYGNIRPDVDENGALTLMETPYDGKWTGLAPENADDMSAIGVHMGLHYSRKDRVAVGIVPCFKGASVIQGFMSEKANEPFRLPAGDLMLDHTYYPWNDPAYLYHLMLEPLFPFAAKAVVWYQGESNRTVKEAAIYDNMLVAMVDEWRRNFRNEALPFVIVQINRFPAYDAEEGVLAIMAAQERAMGRIPYSRMVKAEELGEYERIHPMNKKALTDRIVAALADLGADS